jgi:tRNA A-37 threonylcarbamoyl transferase component Bud32
VNTIDAAALPNLPRDHELPFRLVLADASFVVVDVLRHLPGRRLTVGVDDPARGPGVLKLFFGPHHERDFRRARRGQEAFNKAQVPTTPVVAERNAGMREEKLAWMLFPRLVNARHADAADGEALAGLLGRLHHFGYSHTDLHLGNFLHTADGELLCIDGDAIQDRVLSYRAGLQELAILLAQFEIPLQPDVDQCLDRYSAARGETASTAVRQRMRRLLARAINRRSSHYLEKSLRECSNFESWTDNGARLYCRREAGALFRRFAEDPQQWFADPANLLKSGNSATVAALTIQGVPLVAKRYNITGVLQRIRRIFTRRARNAWQNGLRLTFLGIPTATPLGLIETGSRWWPGPAYVTASGGIDRFTLAELVDIVGWLQRSGLVHGDFKATNFILHAGHLRLIDVDGLVVSDRGQAQDVWRLLSNWQAAPAVQQALVAALATAGLKGPT